jgi:putative transposase
MAEGAGEISVATISRAHKIKLDPNRAQENYFRRACGTRRFAYNWALAEWNRLYELHKQDPEKNPKPGWMALQKSLTQYKKQDDRKWIGEVAANISFRAVRDVGQAWKNYFDALKRGDRSVRKPTFARKGVHDRFYVHNGNLRFDDDGRHVLIEKLGWVRCREPLRFNGKIMSGTVSRAADGWYLSVQVDVPHIVKPHPRPGKIGIDMGVANHAALSNGEFRHLPVESFEKLIRRMRRAQKSLSRKWSGKIKRGHADRALRNEEGQLLPKSKRFIKQAQRVGLAHQRIANVRMDALHKLSRWIVDNFDVIAVENLNIRDMTASAKGTLEEPGRNVKAKAGLNRSMLHAAMRQFRILLEYKSAAVGGRVIPAEPAYTSQTCSACGHCCAENRQTQSEFRCVSCGHAENADVNAAKNILAQAEKGL